MAGGYSSSRSIGIPIGQRGAPDTPPTTPARPEDRPGPSLAARRLPFVFAQVDGLTVPGVVVEQRRGPGGWEVLVALAHAGPDGSGSLSVRWFPAGDVRAASLAGAAERASP